MQVSFIWNTFHNFNRKEKQSCFTVVFKKDSFKTEIGKKLVYLTGE